MRCLGVPSAHLARVVVAAVTAALLVGCAADERGRSPASDPKDDRDEADPRPGATNPTTSAASDTSREEDFGFLVLSGLGGDGVYRVGRDLQLEPVTAINTSVGDRLLTDDGSIIGFDTSFDPPSMRAVSGADAGGRPLDGSGVLGPGSLGTEKGLAAVSPDGRTVAFRGSVGNDYGIYVVGFDGTGTRRLASISPERAGLGESFTDVRLGFSTDGAWLYDGRQVFSMSTGTARPTAAKYSNGTLYVVDGVENEIRRISWSDESVEASVTEPEETLRALIGGSLDRFRISPEGDHFVGLSGGGVFGRPSTMFWGSFGEGWVRSVPLEAGEESFNWGFSFRGSNPGVWVMLFDSAGGATRRIRAGLDDETATTSSFEDPCTPQQQSSGALIGWSENDRGVLFCSAGDRHWLAHGDSEAVEPVEVTLPEPGHTCGTFSAKGRKIRAVVGPPIPEDDCDEVLEVGTTAFAGIPASPDGEDVMVRGRSWTCATITEQGGVGLPWLGTCLIPDSTFVRYEVLGD